MKVLIERDMLRVNCRHCNSILGVTRFDIIYKEKTVTREPFELSPCPVCDYVNPITEALIPTEWLEILFGTDGN